MAHKIAHYAESAVTFAVSGFIAHVCQYNDPTCDLLVEELAAHLRIFFTRL